MSAFVVVAVVSGVCAAAGTAATSEAVRYVSPEPAGLGDGTAAENAAAYTDAAFWEAVRTELAARPVTVRFLPGEYADGDLTLRDMGNGEHRLGLEGAGEGRAVFVERAEEGEERPNTGLYLKGCENVVIRNLHFTGPGKTGYISHFNGKDILLEACTWCDLPNIRYGAAGSTHESTERVVYRGCTFRRIGLNGGAHMIYNAYGPRHVYVVDCLFEDCAGDYVRWRDASDYCVARGCTFRSTGTWPPDEPVHGRFLSVPLFSDVDPGDEFFGTHFVVADNTFDYVAIQAGGMRTALAFLHKGYDPPGLHHLMTPEEGAVLENGTAAERKALLKRNCTIDTSEVRMFGNTYINAAYKATFTSSAAFGAEDKGWSGIAEIFDLLNHEAVFPDWLKPLP